MIKYLILGILAVVLATGLFTVLDNKIFNTKVYNPFLGFGERLKEKVLEKYSYPNLRGYPYSGSVIKLEETIKGERGFRSYIFSYVSDGKRVTGQVNIPSMASVSRKYPVVVLLRGYMDKQTYKTGDGTRRAAAYFAQNGYITLAPDFLGYGGSDPADYNTLKARFETYVTVVNLIRSISSLEAADETKIFLWGHSNGGQIALSVLEITGQAYPTTLWAPVSKPFPYSILFYSDEASDSGKLLRRIVANFDRDYDADLYSPTSYLNWISAPLQIQQGTADDVVLPRWSRELNKNLKDLGKTVKYLEYVGGDHNFSGGVWDRAVADGLTFFNSFVK